MAGETDKQKGRLRQGQTVTLVSIIVTLFLAGIKGVAGIISGSIGLTSDAVHTLSDSVTHITSLFGFMIAQKKADPKFPYGYYKAENFAALAVSVFIAYTGYRLFIESYSKLFTRATLNFVPIAVSVTILSGIVSYLLARYISENSRSINSYSLKAVADDTRVHVVISLFVLFGIMSTYMQIPYIEPMVGIILSIMILRIAYTNGKSAVYSLMDAVVDRDAEREIMKIISNDSDVKQLTALRLRQSGPFMFGDAEIKISRFIDVSRAHQICDRIEQTINQRFSQIESFVIHTEPYTPAIQKLVIPVKNSDGLNSELMGHFARANYFLFVTVEKGSIKSYYTNENPYLDKKVRAGIAVIDEIVKGKADILICREIGEISFHTIRDKMIDVYVAEGKTAEDVIENFIQNKLKRMEKPTKKSDYDLVGG